MKLQKITDPSFRAYARVVTEFDCTELMQQMRQTPLPQDVTYVASAPELERLPIFRQLSERAYGGMEIQMGYCNGHNRRLDALEYHKSSEWNLACTDLILILGREQDIDPETLCYDTSKLEAFLVPAGTAFETYATTLHYAPCGVEGAGFRLVVVLPRGTNLPLETVPACEGIDRLLFCRNKWLLAHPEAQIDGAFNGLTGENPTV